MAERQLVAEACSLADRRGDELRAETTHAVRAEVETAERRVALDATRTIRVEVALVEAQNPAWRQ